MLIQGINVGTKVATKLGPKVISKLKTMDKSKVSSIVNKAKDLSGKAITEFKRSFLSLPKKAVRDKGEFKVGTVARRGVKRRDKGRFETQDKGQKGEIAPTKKTDQTVVTRNKKGQLLNISNKFKKTLGKSESRVAKRKRKRAIAKTTAIAGGLTTTGKLFKKASGKDLSSYTVKKGDTLSEIAKRTPNATLGQIKKVNPNIEDLNKIKPGQKINVPGKVLDRESVYQDLTKSEMKKITMKRQAGGPLKPIPAGNKGLPNLPKSVRNEMGFMKAGGKIQKRAGGGVALRGFGATRKI
jgi:LysM repeat protein